MIEIFQIDAFTDKVFHGNPAAVCLLSEWLNDELMRAIAAENNLSETAFVLENNDEFEIRWFTPTGEINLCGHATLAAGFVLFELKKRIGEKLSFSSISGPLTIYKKSKGYTLDLPRLSYHPLVANDQLGHLVSHSPLEMYDSDLDYLFVYDNENMVRNIHVDLTALTALSKRGLIITAIANENGIDFYSRCFYPRHHIDEDPVTGSAYGVLAPFWSDRLNKSTLHAIQGSIRRGNVYCEVLAERVLLSGHCKLYSKGCIVI